MMTSKEASAGTRGIVDAVADDDLGAWIVPGSGSNVGQELLGEPDDFAVDLHHDGLLDIAMLQHAAQHATVAGADDQYAPGVAVRQERHVREHFLIDEFVALGDLNTAVEHHDAAVRKAVEDDDVLEGTDDVGEFFLGRGSVGPSLRREFR